MTDSNIDEHSGDAATSNQVTYQIDKIDGGYILTLNADPAWLSSPDRVFPIYLDPSTSVNDPLGSTNSSKFNTRKIKFN